MRTFSCLLMLSALIFAGCESDSDTFRERFNPVPPKTQVFDGDRPTVLLAALQAFHRLDLHVLKSSPNHIQAASYIHSSVVFGDTRQLVVDVDLGEAGPGKTEVALSLVEQVESGSTGGTHQDSLRENGFFANYFAMLQQVLQENAAAAAAEKK